MSNALRRVVIIMLTIIYQSGLIMETDERLLG